MTTSFWVVICVVRREIHVLQYIIIIIVIIIIIILWLYSTVLGLCRFFSFLILLTVAGLLGRGSSPSQGRYLHTEEHKRGINGHNANIYSLIGIRTHDRSVRTSEDSSCLRLSGTVIGWRTFSLQYSGGNSSYK
jgi:hypothetical protein